MRGSAEVSAGGSAETERLKQAACPGSPRPARSSRPPATRAGSSHALRSLGGEAGAALTAYLDLVGNRLFDASTSPSPPDDRSRRTRSCGPIRIVGSGEALAASDVEARPPRSGPRSRRAPGRVRRTSRRGPPHLPSARRAWRLQRHLGLGPDAAGGSRRGPAGRESRAASPPLSTCWTPASTRCARWSRAARPVADELARRAEYRATYTAKGRPAVPRTARAAPARPVDPAARPLLA
jgi:hypothetical protein